MATIVEVNTSIGGKSSLHALPRPFVIGMVHLAALPGAPGYRGDFERVLDRARQDATALTDGGVAAIMVENFFDVPFTRHRVEAETVAAMTTAVLAVREATPLPVGVNVLRNDACTALAIAVATGASFIRVNVLSGARLTDQGLVQGVAYELLRLRAGLNADHVTILADVDVKHSAPLAPYDPLQEAEEAVERACAGAIIVTGDTTGRTIDETLLERLASAGLGVPLVVGSGVTPESIPRLVRWADGFIVGTSLKKDGMIDNPVSVERVSALMEALGKTVSP